jgi:hypothetical protein
MSEQTKQSEPDKIAIVTGSRSIGRNTVNPKPRLQLEGAVRFSSSAWWGTAGTTVAGSSLSFCFSCRPLDGRLRRERPRGRCDV